MKAIIWYHNDLDGLAGAIIAQKGLRKMGYDVHIMGGSVLNKNVLLWLQKANVDLYVFIDKGSREGELINKYLINKKVWIFDHHPRYSEPLPNVDLYINPTERGKDSLRFGTSSSIVFQYFYDKDLVRNSYSILGIVGMCADDAGFFGELSGANAYALEVAIDAGHISYKRDIAIRYKRELSLVKAIDANYIPVPKENFDEIIPEKCKSINWYEVQQKDDLLDELSDVFEIPKIAIRETPHISHVEIHDIIPELYQYFHKRKEIEAIQNIWRKNLPRKIRHKRFIRGSRIRVKHWIETKKYNILLFEGINVPGVYFSHVANRVLKNKPLLGILKHPDKTFIITREHPKHYKSYDLGKEMYKISKMFGGYGGGHKYVASASIPSNMFENLMQYLGVVEWTCCT